MPIHVRDRMSRSGTAIAFLEGGTEGSVSRNNFIVAAILMALSASFAYGQDAGSPAVHAFGAATRDYASMHRRLERQIGSIDINTPVESINRRMNELAAAIRAERADAKQGDLFTPALAQELRASVNRALLASDFTAEDVRAAGRVEGINDDTVALRVNGTFPWVLGAAMFPCVIAELPALPPELQYRIVGNDLVLVDVHASLIVDILSNVLVDFTRAE